MNIIGKRFWFFLISAVIIIAGLVGIGVYGLRPSIQFKSGSELTVTFDKAVTRGDISATLQDLGYKAGDIVVQGVQNVANQFIITLPEIKTDAEKDSLVSGLQGKLGTFKDDGFQTIPPAAAAETTRNTIIAVVISAAIVLLYISWAFRKMPNPFRWGVCAIASLIHDVLVVIGVFAICGGLLGWQVDLLFVAGVLTVIGYSVNDTIVIFDRIRENLSRNPGADFETVVNYSLVETMSRTLITGIAVLFVVTSLLIVLGEPIQNLVVVMLIGTVTGAYSSIGVAASLLVVWRKKEWGRLIGRKSTQA
jgi:preprotein translocase subunit SecF